MSNYGNASSSAMSLLDELDRRVYNLEQMVTSTSFGSGQQVAIPSSDPGGNPVVIQQLISPPSSVTVKTGAFYGNIYADVMWTPPEDGTAISYEIDWAIKQLDGTFGIPGAARVGGNQYRINGLSPNSTYQIEVYGVNVLGQMARYPTGADTWVTFTTGNDQTVPPAVSNVKVSKGATTVVVTFDPLTFEQAPDVANGSGTYQIDLSNDPTFGTLFRTTRTTSSVVSFSDIYPHAQLVTPISATEGVSGSTPVTPLGYGSPPIMTGTFIQESPTIDAWTGTRWGQEMDDMTAIGIRTLILQWSLDQDDQKVLYRGPPVPNIPGTSTPFIIGPDYVDNLLFNAVAHGDDVWLGLSNYGTWQSHANDSTWLNQQLALSKQVADELYALYGTNSAFVGWYIPFEIDAVLLSTPANIGPMTSYFTSLINYLHSHYPSKKVMVSPTYSINGVALGPAAYASALLPVVAGVDVINLQDGGSNQSSSTITSYFSALHTALANTTTQLWSNPDMFSNSGGPMASSQLQSNILAAAPYVVKITGFSFPTQMGPHDISSTAYADYQQYFNALGLLVQFSTSDGFPTSVYNATVDQELMTFVPGGDKSAFIAARNVGPNAPAYGPVPHAVGAPVSVQTGVTWYARVYAIDASGNEGPPALSGPIDAQGVIDEMIVGDLSAAHITFGTMKGDRIEINSLTANTIKTSYLASGNIHLLGGGLYAGDPPGNGLLINSQGIRLYAGGAVTVSLDTYSGSGYFSGTVSASTITGSTINGGSINSAVLNSSTINSTTINGGTINSTTLNSTTINSSTINSATINGGTITGITISGNNVTGGTISGVTITSSTINSTNINTSNINTATINGSTWNNGSLNSATSYSPSFRDPYIMQNGGDSNTNFVLNGAAKMGLIYGLTNNLTLALLMLSNPGDIYVGGNHTQVACFGTFETVANLSYAGDIFVAGGLTANGPKSFRIPHPNGKADTELVYACIESPRVELVYRGKATTKNGSATVDLDTYFNCSNKTFESLTRADTRQVFLFNETSDGRVSYTIQGGKLTITSVNTTETVGWMVVAERADKSLLKSTGIGSDGRLMNETKKRRSILSSDHAATLAQAEKEMQLSRDLVEAGKNASGS